MKQAIDHRAADIFGHEPKRKELPLLDFDLSGFQAIKEHIDKHLPKNDSPAESKGTNP